MTSTMPIAARFTREEYLALSESPPGVRFELLDGELVTMNDPLPLHQLVVGALHAELRSWCRSPGGHGRVLLPVDTEIGPSTVFGPDLQWFAGDRDVPPIDVRPWPVGDLVVEVASPSTARYDALTKLGRYLESGAREVWLVTPEPRGARIVRAREDELVVEASGTLASPMLPGFALPLAALLD